MKKKITVIITVIAMAVLLIMPTVAFAEASPAVYGYLIDSSGNHLENALITNVNTATEASNTATTEADGSFKIPAMSEGVHTIKVTLDNGDGAEVGTTTITVSIGDSVTLSPDGENFKVTVPDGMETLYMNLQTNGNGSVLVLDCSDSQLADPQGTAAAAAPADTGTEAPAAAATLDDGVTTPRTAGYITDSTGAAMADTTVVFSNSDKGTTDTGTTNSDGTFRTSQLSPGTYTVSLTDASGSILASAVMNLSVGDAVGVAAGAAGFGVTVTSGLAELNLGLTDDGAGGITFAEASDTAIASPAAAQPEPSASAEASGELSPVKTSKGLSTQAIIIIIVIIGAGVAIAFVVINMNKGGNGGGGQPPQRRARR